MLDRGMLRNEAVSTKRKFTAGDGLGGVTLTYSDNLSRLWCRIFKPAVETTYEDEGMRDESLMAMRCHRSADVEIGDKIIRADGTELIVVMAKHPKSWEVAGNMHRYFYLREIKIPASRPASD